MDQITEQLKTIELEVVPKVKFGNFTT